MLLILVVIALGVYMFVREKMFQQLDSRLKDNLSLIAETATSQSGEIAEIERHTLVLAFRVMNGDWTEYASGGWLAAGLDATGSRPVRGRWIYEAPGGGVYHLDERIVETGDRRLLVTTAEQGEQIHRSLRRLGATLAGSFPIALLLSAVGGYFLARRALTPLQQITSRARTIRADNLSERLAVSNPEDELGQLSAVLNDAFARLEDAFERLRSFTQDAAHELRTPLSVIRSVGEAGLQTDRDADGYRETIGSMLEEVDRLAVLVDDLLTLARGESGRFSARLQPEDLCTITRDVVECLRVLAEEKHQELGFDIPGKLIVSVDRDTLRVALMNILSNAIRFTPVDGRIEIRIGALNEQDSFVEICDNGPGIALQEQEKIFDRFYRVDRSRSQESGGAGLGLAIARWAAQTNGGKIFLESEPGQGSRFRIVLKRTVI